MNQLDGLWAGKKKLTGGAKVNAGPLRDEYLLFGSEVVISWLTTDVGPVLFR